LHTLLLLWCLQAPTGETALLLACSCTAPDQQLIADLLAAGASSAVQDRPAGNNPLLLAMKLGGPAGLALAKLLLQQQRGLSPVSTAGDSAGAGAGGSGLQDRCSIDASNAAGETALGLAAAAALAGSAPAGKPSPTPAASKAAAAAAAAAAAQSSADVAQQLLGVVLSGQPTVPEQLGATLLQAGLSGKLPDAITAQVRHVSNHVQPCINYAIMSYAAAQPQAACR
jgi:hypothetical protein